MRLLALCLLLAISLFAQEKKQSVTLGAGLYAQTQPYKNVDDLLLPSPVIFYDYSVFYVRWTRFGAYFLGEKNESYSWGLSLTAQPRTYGYESSDIAGLKEKKDSWEGGLALSVKKGPLWAEITALTDILNSEKRWLSALEIGYDFKVSNFSFYPSIYLSYLSFEFNNYYYGVSENEAQNSLFSAYKADSALLFAAQTYIEYPLTNKLSTLVNIKANVLPKSSYDSPLVNERFIFAGLLSLIYTFEY
jgi:outer membrane protein